MAETVEIEWIGVRLPSDNIMVQYDMVRGVLPKSHVAAIDLCDHAMLPFVRQDGVDIGWLIGPNPDSEFSKHYLFTPETNFIQDMTVSDWRILKKMPVARQFRNNSDERDRHRKADFPDPLWLGNIEINRFGKLVIVGRQNAAVAMRLANKYARKKEAPKAIGQKIGRWG